MKKRMCRKILPFLKDGESIYNTLLVSKPGAGKTTCLRDCIRSLSNGKEGWEGMKICVVDERSEIAACHLGIPQNDMGIRTDVLSGCGKSEGMMLMLRSMSPQIIAVDELGGKRFSGSRTGSLFRGTDSWNSTCGYGGRIMGETISEKVDEAWNF